MRNCVFSEKKCCVVDFLNSFLIHCYTKNWEHFGLGFNLSDSINSVRPFLRVLVLMLWILPEGNFGAHVPEHLFHRVVWILWAKSPYSNTVINICKISNPDYKVPNTLLQKQRVKKNWAKNPTYADTKVSRIFFWISNREGFYFDAISDKDKQYLFMDLQIRNFHDLGLSDSDF